MWKNTPIAIKQCSVKITFTLLYKSGIDSALIILQPTLTTQQKLLFTIFTSKITSPLNRHFNRSNAISDKKLYEKEIEYCENGLAISKIKKKCPEVFYQLLSVLVQEQYHKVSNLNVVRLGFKLRDFFSLFPEMRILWIPGSNWLVCTYP